MGWNTLCWSFSTQGPAWWFYPTSCLKFFVGFPLHWCWNLEITMLSVRSCMIPLLLLLILSHLSTAFQFTSVSVVSDSLRPHESQHTRPPCLSPALGVYPNSCSLSQWCHPTISSSVVPFSSCPQSFPASGSFQMSQLFASGGQVLEFQLQHQSFQWIFRTDPP